MVFTLVSCAGGNHVPLDSEAYVKTLDYSDSFRILQLTDIHWNFLTDMEASEAYLDVVVRSTHPDLIVITGDQCLDINAQMLTRLYEHFPTWGIPYAILWGNHDWQGTFSRNLPPRLAKLGGDLSLYTEVNDDVMGRSNYVINLDQGGVTKWQVYCFDDNAYEYVKSSPMEVRYEYIHDDQVAWYEAQVAKAGNVPNISYMHMPQWEWVYEYAKRPEAQTGDRVGDIGTINETSTYSVPGLTGESFTIGATTIEIPEDGVPFWPGDSGSKIVKSGQAHNMKAIQVGHDHANGWGVSYDGINDDETPIFLGYGVKSGNGLYCARGKHNGVDYDISGGAITILHDDGSYEIEHRYFSVSTNVQAPFYQKIAFDSANEIIEAQTGWFNL